MKAYSHTLFKYKGFEFSFYFHPSLLLLFTVNTYKTTKEPFVLWAVQIGLLGANLRLTNFKL